MRRGFTLIELMVAVAILGIAGGVLGHEIVQLRAETAVIAQRERALQALEYEADAVVRGQPSNAKVRAALLAEVPGGALKVEPVGADATRLIVEWKSPRGPASRSLVVIGRPR